MKPTKSGAAVAAGDTHSEFGAALDHLLPMPQGRRSFRRWRHTRPFWAGMFVIIGGLVIISYPLGPLVDMMAVGSAALTGVAIGLILVTGGLFFWFAPHQRLFISIVLMICSVLSLVASNLGGFLIGMVLGMVGSSMAFGWKPAGERSTGTMPEGEKPSPVPRSGSSTNGTAVVFAIVGVLLTGALAMAAPARTALALGGAAAQSDRPEGRPPLPRVACGRTTVSTGTLSAKNVQVRGTTYVQDGCGNSIELVDLYIPEADLGDYRVDSPGGTFRIATNLHIERIELETPNLTANVDIAGLVVEQLGIDAELLPPILRPNVGPVPITPQLVRTLRSLGLATPKRPFVINALNATSVHWIQPIIRGGDVYLSDARLSIDPRLLPLIG